MALPPCASPVDVTFEMQTDKLNPVRTPGKVKTGLKTPIRSPGSTLNEWVGISGAARL